MEVEIILKQCIKPSSSTQSHLKTYEVSLWDQFMPPIFFSTALFYPNSTSQTSLLLKHSLSKTLSHFYPLSGKIKDYVSIDCNDEGACYTEAKANIPMHEFLTKPNLSALKKFIPDVSVLNKDPIGASVLMIQETTFPCGGLAIGISVSHIAVDANGLCSFIKAWASAASSSPNKELTISLYLDSPLVFPLYESFPKEALFPALWTPFARKRKVVVKRLMFDASSIEKLKSEATSSVKNPSRVEVVSAVISKSVKAALNAKSIAICHSANLRRKATPPIPDCSMGNFVWLVQAICGEEEREISELVLKLRNAKMKLESEFVRNAKEGGFLKMFEEVKKMKCELSENGLEMVGLSSWCNFGMYNESDFGFGKPIWNTHCTAFDSEEIMYHNMGNLNDTRTGNGVEAWMYLYPEVAAFMEQDVELLKYASVDPSPLII